jgi:hypothetical protein
MVSAHKMTGEILIITLPQVYLAALISRNRIVRAKTQQRIRAADPQLTALIVLTRLCILTAMLSAPPRHDAFCP